MQESMAYQRLRAKLYRKIPALALPLGLMEWKHGDVAGTDGVWFYGSEADLESGQISQEILLHSILHAVLGHPQSRGRREEGRWYLACDLTVTFLQNRLLNIPMDGVIGRIYYACDPQWVFSAKKVYDLLDGGHLAPKEELTLACCRDSHTYWNAAEQSHRLNGPGEGNRGIWEQQKKILLSRYQPERPKIGTGTESRKLELTDIPEQQSDFGHLLRMFSEVRENRHVNDVDFAYAWYAYGMEHYDAMPLLEPLEYSEERKIGELAVVLDTSASCSRGLTARFLGALYHALCRERLFFDRFRLHILQCDCQVQRDDLVTNLDEFQWYLEHLELYGGGGTDYRPAFERIDRLVDNGELPRLGGVLYFTDGYGVFPAKKPLYPTAFVLLQYRYDDINIPDWAIKLVLEAEKPGRDEGWI